MIKIQCQMWMSKQNCRKKPLSRVQCISSFQLVRSGYAFLQGVCGQSVCSDLEWCLMVKIISNHTKFFKKPIHVYSTLSPIWLIFNINMSFWLMVCRDNSYSFQDKRFLFCILTVHMSERCPYYWDFCFG